MDMETISSESILKFNASLEACSIEPLWTMTISQREQGKHFTAFDHHRDTDSCIDFNLEINFV